MEKELIINGIKYVRSEEKKYKVGDIVTYNGYEWFVIKTKDNTVTLMLKNVLSKSKIKEYFDSKYLDDSNDVKFNADKTDFDWQNSIIREGLNERFLNNFNKKELNIMRTNYDEDKISEDYIRLVTIRDIDRLPLEIRDCSREYWTMSPYYFSSYFSDALVWHVHPTGSLGAYWTTAASGVRPVINLNTNILDNYQN